MRHSVSSLFSRIAAVALVASGLSILAPPLSAEPFATATLPVQDGEDATWAFFGDKVVGLEADIKGDAFIGHFNAYSLAESKFLWRVDASLGDKDLEVAPRSIPDYEKNLWLIGTGPLSLLDVSTGTIKWTIPCDKIGFIQPEGVTFLSGDRLVASGSTKCKQKSTWDAMDDACYTMVNTATGQVVWQHPTKCLTYDLALGYWARVAKFQGRKVQNKRRQLESFLVSPAGAGYEISASAPDRFVIAGERLEGVSLADGSSIYTSKDKPGIVRGAYGQFVFFKEGGKITAFNAGTGAEAWQFDLKGKGSTVYTGDDLVAQGGAVPEGMTDIMISEPDVVSRVSTSTGKALWTVKRGGMNWMSSANALLTKGGDKTTAYDWTTGKKLWEVKAGSKPENLDSGDDIILVDADKDQPPYRFTVVNAKTGQVAWTMKQVDGKDIMSHSFVVPGQIRLMSEKGVVANVNVADGKPGTAPEGIENQRYLWYSTDEKTLTCRDYAGNVAWSRKGEISEASGLLSKKDYVVWPMKDGTVEVIALADGASRWKAQFGQSPCPYLNTDGTYLVVQKKKEVTIVKIPS